MASSSPDSDWGVLPDGWTLSDVGHGASDVVGLIPIVGEGADLSNAAWHAAEGNYLEAGLSIVSIVPIVGDVIGKGGKLLGKGAGKLAGPALTALKRMDFAKMLAPLAKHPKIGPHVEKIVAALEKWRRDLSASLSRQYPNGLTRCPYADSLGKASKEFSHVDPGPLPDRLAETFAGGRYREVVTTKDIVLKRAGKDGRPLGEFFSTESASGVVQTRIDKAVLPEWSSGAKSPIDSEFDVRIPKGTKIYVGEVGSQGGFYVGGTRQIVVPKPWENPAVKVVGQRSLK